MGYRTILTLTGSTTREMLAQYSYQPDAVIESIAELIEPRKFISRRLPVSHPEDDSVSFTPARTAVPQPALMEYP